ncbi:MAG: hypothetical protein ACJZ7Z_04260 [Myxococcota bacterium]
MNSLFIRKASYVTAHLTVLVVSGVLIAGSSCNSGCMNTLAHFASLSAWP